MAILFSRTSITTVIPKPKEQTLPLVSKPLVPEVVKQLVVSAKQEIPIKVFSAAKPKFTEAVSTPLKQMIVEAEKQAKEIISKQEETTKEEVVTDLVLDCFVRIKPEYRVGEENLLGKVVYIAPNSQFVRVQWEVAGSFGVGADILIDYRAKKALEIVPTPARYRPFSGKKVAKTKDKDKIDTIKPIVKKEKNVRKRI